MNRFIMLLCVLAVAGCGVQGELYRPTDAKPDPKTRKEQTRHPFPDQPPEEQEVMPDLI
jgi:predicted small lipoprotein YifL